MARRRKKSSGFKIKSLITLLVVVAILGVLYAYRKSLPFRVPFFDRVERTIDKGKTVAENMRPKQEAPIPEPEVKQTVPPEPEVIRVKTPPSTAPAYTVKNPQFDNLAYGIPGPADTIVEREGYALGYIEYHEQPAWVIYHMTKQEAITKAARRGNDFREDPAIPTGSATLGDYRRSGYDRGHLAPAADMAFTMKTMSESFFMSNMSPQKPAFNRGVWKDLEEQVRQFAISEQDIYVVTGPILPATKTVTIGSNQVTVPKYYYKVIYDRTPPEKMIGFILPNDGSDKPLQSFAVTVDAVEEATGLDFFSTIPQPKQEQLESTISVQDWRWKRRK